jgi:hypothetical protein
MGAQRSDQLRRRSGAYDTRRARGATHHAALRALANRLVGILRGCLRDGTSYDETIAWPQLQVSTQQDQEPLLDTSGPWDVWSSRRTGQRGRRGGRSRARVGVESQPEPLSATLAVTPACGLVSPCCNRAGGGTSGGRAHALRALRHQRAPRRTLGNRSAGPAVGGFGAGSHAGVVAQALGGLPTRRRRSGWAADQWHRRSGRTGHADGDVEHQGMDCSRFCGPGLGRDLIDVPVP